MWTLSEVLDCSKEILDIFQKMYSDLLSILCFFLSLQNFLAYWFHTQYYFYTLVYKHT